MTANPFLSHTPHLALTQISGANFFWVKSWDPDHEITGSSYVWVIRIKQLDQRNGRPATNEQWFIYIYVGIGWYRSYPAISEIWPCKVMMSSRMGLHQQQLWMFMTETQVNIGNGLINLCMKPSQAATHNHFTRWLPWPVEMGFIPQTLGNACDHHVKKAKVIPNVSRLITVKTAQQHHLLQQKHPAKKNVADLFYVIAIHDMCHTWNISTHIIHVV